MIHENDQTKEQQRYWAVVLLRLATLSAIAGIGTGVFLLAYPDMIVWAIFLTAIVLTFGLDRLGTRYAKQAGIFLMLIGIIVLMPSSGHAQWQTKQYHAKQVAGTNTAQATVNVQNISPNDPGWKTELLRVHNADKNRAAELQKQAEENAAYLQALNALGVPSYAQSYSGASVAQSAAYGGNSIYGYTYSSIADYYNPADRGVLLNQYQNATNRSLDLADKASSNLKDLYVAEIGTQERTASTIAESQKIEALAKVLEASKTTHTQVQTNYQVQGAGAGPDPIPPPAPSTANLQPPSEARMFATSQCAKCHSGAKPPKGIILDGSSPLSIDHYTASVRAVDRGTMPPPDSSVILTQPEQDEVIAGLKQLLGN